MQPALMSLCKRTKISPRLSSKSQRTKYPRSGHYKIFCVNAKYGIQYGFRIFYLIALQNEENYEREESCSA